MNPFETAEAGSSGEKPFKCGHCGKVLVHQLDQLMGDHLFAFIAVFFFFVMLLFVYLAAGYHLSVPLKPFICLMSIRLIIITCLYYFN